MLVQRKLKYMKSFARKFVALKLILIALIISPLYLRAQSRMMGELTITKLADGGFVTVNGERATTGRSIAASSEIATSAQASAKVLLPQTGTVLIAPATKLNLSFVAGSVSGDLSSGEITIETAPGTTLNFLTPDGAITLPAAAQSNVVKLSVENRRTRVQTLTGQASFNNVTVSAGEFYPAAADSGSQAQTPNNNSSSSRRVSPLLILGILGAVGAVVVVALSSSSGGRSDTPVLSPVR